MEGTLVKSSKVWLDEINSSFQIENNWLSRVEATFVKLVGNHTDLESPAGSASLRLFSPEELENKKLSSVFGCASRTFQWDEYPVAKGVGLLRF